MKTTATSNRPIMSPYIYAGIHIPVGFYLHDEVIKPRDLTLSQKIIDITCEVFGITIQQVKGQSRIKEIVDCRRAAMYLCHLYIKPRPSLKTIGAYFNGKDHATVLHSIKTSKNLIETDPDFRVNFKLAENKVKSSCL